METEIQLQLLLRLVQLVKERASLFTVPAIDVPLSLFMLQISWQRADVLAEGANLSGCSCLMRNNWPNKLTRRATCPPARHPDSLKPPDWSSLGQGGATVVRQQA